MMRKLFSMLICLGLLLSLSPAASAAYPPLMDGAELLSPEEQDSIQKFCLDLRETTGLDVAICTVNSLEGKTAQTFADDWYDDHNYGQDGVLFLIAMEEREWYISTAGNAIAALSDDDLEQIEYEVIPYLSDGAYYQAFYQFLSVLPGFLEEGQPVDVYYDAQGKLHAVYETEEPGVNLFLSLIIGIVAAAISLLVMRSTMNTRRPQRSAGNYEIRDSYRLTQHQDLFLYSNVSKVRRQQSSSSGGSSVHRSSSGASHGGRGGKF